MELHCCFSGRAIPCGIPLYRNTSLAGGNDCGIIPIEAILADKSLRSDAVIALVSDILCMHDAPRIVMDFIKHYPADTLTFCSERRQRSLEAVPAAK
jgi:hypothetical protein